MMKRHQDSQYLTASLLGQSRSFLTPAFGPLNQMIVSWIQHCRFGLLILTYTNTHSHTYNTTHACTQSERLLVPGSNRLNPGFPNTHSFISDPALRLVRSHEGGQNDSNKREREREEVCVTQTHTQFTFQLTSQTLIYDELWNLIKWVCYLGLLLNYVE